jgi:enoyl-CoA hydratase
MKNSLIKNIQQLEESSDVKVIVLLSKVKKAFCAGANIKEFVGKTTKDFENNDIFAELHNTVYGAKKPIIAGVNGVALGGGFELALICDMIYCSE